MRIVLDTNTSVSGLLWGGPPRRIIELGLSRQVTLCVSAGMIDELASVIVRPKFQPRLHAAGISAKTLLASYVQICEIVVSQPLAQQVSRDPDDDIVLACALAASAALIVSGDKDLLVLERFRGVDIFPASKALQRIQAP